MKITRKAERWLLLIAFLSTAITGIALHIAGHGESHAHWHNWAVAHIVSSLAWLTGTIVHVKRHWQWYRLTFRKGLGKKSKVTLFLSIVFAFVLATGIILLVGVDGANSETGLWHYQAGLLLAFLSLMHVLKRRRLFF